MLEGFIEKLILSYFGDYIENLDTNKLSLGLWSGSLVLEDIMIRAKAINDLKLPFKLCFGKIGKLTLSIPWKQNFSVPTIITVDRVQIVLSLIKKEDWEFIDYISYDAKIGYLMKFANDRIYQLSQAFVDKNDSTSTSTSNSSGGYLDRVIVKVLDNLHVNFKNINIRIEDSYSIIPYSFGITLQEVFVVNTNEKWEQEFIDRNVNKNINVFKLLKISNFGIYLKTNETVFFNKEQIEDIDKIMTNFFPNGSPKANDMDYLIQPMSLTAKMKLNNGNGSSSTGTGNNSGLLNTTNAQLENLSGTSNSISRMLLYISLDSFDFDIQKSQFDCLIRILNDVSNYQKFQYDYNYNTIKYKYFKPKCRILVKADNSNITTNADANINNETQLIEKTSSSSVKNENAIEWWKFSIKMIIKQIQYFKGNTTVFDMPMHIQEKYKSEFGSLFYKYFKNPKDGLDPEEYELFHNIIEFTDLKELYLRSKPVLQDIYTERKKEEKKKAQTGYLTYLIGLPEDSDLITKEEQEKIDEILCNAIEEATTSIINKDIETKLQVKFILKEGSFNLSNQINAKNVTIKEGFGMRYKNLSISVRKGEFFMELDAELKEFQIDMYTIINQNTIKTPITFKILTEDYIINNPVIQFNNNSSNNNNENIVDLSKSEFDIENNNTCSKKNNGANKIIEPIIPNEDDYFLRVYFRKNNPNEKINSKLRLDINVLHLTYHQVFLERMVNFFKVDLNEDLTNKAWDKISLIKEETQKTLKENMYKRNIVEINIEPRKVVIPINKYDIKNTKLLLIDLGRLSMLNDKDNDNDYPNKTTKETMTNSNQYLNKYKQRYNLQLDSLSISYFSSLKKMISNKSRFDIVTDVTATLGFALLNRNYSNEQYPNFQLFFEIHNITFNLNYYLYSLLTYIVDILKPAKEVDLWCQLTTDKDEITRNAKEVSKIWKKNRTLLNWEEYYAVLANGYIYFYNRMDDIDYVGYYYLKDTIITETPEANFEVKLSNKYGTIELKFRNESKYEQWIKSINERIREIKLSSDDKTEVMDIETAKMKINPKIIFFGGEITLKQITLNLYAIANQSTSTTSFNSENIGRSNANQSEKRKDDINSSSGPTEIAMTQYEKLFTLTVTHLFLNIQLREYDTLTKLSIEGIKLLDNLSTIEEFKEILWSVDINDKQTKIFDLTILLCEEQSDKYNNTQIDININIGYLYVIWNPIVIRRLLGFLVHNDIQKHKIQREISIQNEKLLDSNFLAPGTEEEVLKPLCSVSKYTYIKLHSQFKKVSISWIQPVLNIKFNEMRFGQSYLNCDMKVDHFKIEGALGNTQLFDLCQYPFVIKSQSEFDSSKIKEMFGIKENSSSLIEFEYKSMCNWCPECKDNYLSEADVKINSAFLIYVHEHFMRFFDYFISEFLGALGASEEVKKFKNAQYKISLKKEKDIDFMKLNLNITNPQIILKPRYHFKEHFLIDLGNVTLKCFYQKIYGKIRNNPNEYRWTTTYQFNMKNVNIRTEDDFKILSPTNGIVNMHFNSYTEEDKLMSELDYDFSYQFDLFFNSLNLKLRQKDLTNILRCLDLNILYTDERGFDYLDEKERSKLVMNDNNSSIDKDSTSTASNISKANDVQSKKSKDDLLKTYYSILAFIIIPKVSLKLFINDEEKSFMEFILQETQINYFQMLNMEKLTHIVIADMEALENDKEKDSMSTILADFTQLIQEMRKDNSKEVINKSANSEIEKAIDISSSKDSSLSLTNDNNLNDFCKKALNEIENATLLKSRVKEGTKMQADIQITIHPNREKTYSVLLNGFKLLFRIDTFQLCRYFFMEAFPFYDKTQKDLPNSYDSDEDNYPGMRLNVEIKKPLICFMTDHLSNISQELICITSEVIVAMKNKKIAQVKQELYKRNKELSMFLDYMTDKEQRETLLSEMTNDKSFIWSFNLSLFEICPFVCTIKDVLYSKELVISKRKIMDNFVFTYESKTEMQFIKPNTFVLTSLDLIDLNKITVKASYRDIVLYNKMYKYYYSTLNERYYASVDELKKYSKAKRENEELNERKEKREDNKEHTEEESNHKTIEPMKKEKEKDLIINHSDEEKDSFEDEEIPNEFENDNDNKMNEIKKSNVIASKINRQKTKTQNEMAYLAKGNIVDKGMGKRSILSKGFQLILIDDHSNTFYPFLSIIISEFSTITEYLNYNQNIVAIKVVGKVLSYNYIAGGWEPLIEKTNIAFDITRDYSNSGLHTNTYVIKTQPIKNAPDISINISDLTVSFLYTILNNWLDKYKKYKALSATASTSQILDKEKNMEITNHTVFNYSGRPMTIYRRFVNKDQIMKKSKLCVLPPNEAYEIEYFACLKEEENKSDKDLASNLLQENYISFNIENAIASNHIIKIDNMQTKVHKVDYSKIVQTKQGEKYGYLISKIEFHQLKKFIYFYSPLSFKNKTTEKINLKIFNLTSESQSKPLIYELNCKKTFGVPHEYLNGFVEISQEQFQVTKQFSLAQFMTKSKVKEEIQFNRNNFISVIYSQNDQRKNKIIKFCNNYSIRNCLPFLIKIVLSGTNKVIELNKNETINLSSLSIYSNLKVSISFHSFKTPGEITLYDQRNPLQCVSIPMLDDYNNSFMIYSSLINAEDRDIVIHANNIIVNHTGLNLTFLTVIENKRRILTNQKGDNNFFFFTDDAQLVIEYREYTSSQISIKAVGTSNVVYLQNSRSQVIEFIMEIKLSLLSLDLDLYTNIITFVPRYIMYNQLECAIEIVLRTKLTKSILESNVRSPLYSYVAQEGQAELIYLSLMEEIDNDIINNINIKSIGNEKKDFIWELSTPIDISSGTLTTLVVYSMNKKRKRYINVEKKLDNLSTYIILKKCDYSTSQITIENNSSNFSFKLWQKNYETKPEYIDIKSKSIYAWSNISSNLILNLHYYQGSLTKCPLIKGSNIKKYELLDDKVISFDKEYQNIQKYPYSEIVQVKTDKYSGTEFKIEIKSDGCKIEIRIEDIAHQISAVIKEKDKQVNEFSLYINKLGLSIIGDNKNIRNKNEPSNYARFELCYIYFDYIVFYSKVEEIESNYYTEFQVLIKDIEIDNQYEYVKIFPIICLPEITPRRSKLIEMESKQPFFNCYISMHKLHNEDITRIILFNYLIQAFDLNIESNVLVAFLNLSKNLTIAMDTSVTRVHPLFLNEEKQKEMNVYIKDWYYKPNWNDQIIFDRKQRLFISQVEASSLEITFTFISQTKDKVFQKLIQSNPLLSSVLNAVSNIEKSSLLLNGCQMYNFKGDWIDLILNILYVYQQNMLVQMMKMFGSIDILGNPLNLMNSLGKGFKDLFQKPAQGIMKGPLQGAIGLVNGGISLAKHTVDGTFNTTSKITSGLSKGMLLLTQDEEYINERDMKKITEKPNNFVEGIGFGLSSVAGGIFHGVTDIFKKPIEGAQRDSIKGFGKGLLMGFSGAIIKPISGLFDLVSKTTEGIKNTVANEEVLNALRLPRPFYGKNKLVKSYNQCDAQVIALLNTKIEQMKNKTIDFYSCEIYKNQKEDSILLAFLTDGIYIIDIVKRELKTVLEYSIIKEVIYENQQKIKMHFTVEINHKTSTSISISKSSNAKKVYEKILDAIETNCEGKTTYKR